jgi:DNA polymerase III delta prime subunit
MYNESLFVYKYRPLILEKTNRQDDVYILHELLDKQTFPNIILYGPHGSGKHTLLYAFIRSFFNKMSAKDNLNEKINNLLHDNVANPPVTTNQKQNQNQTNINNITENIIEKKIKRMLNSESTNPDVKKVKKLSKKAQLQLQQDLDQQMQEQLQHKIKNTSTCSSQTAQSDIIHTTCTIHSYRINSKDIEIPVFHSNYHIELDILDFMNYVRQILPDMIKKIAGTKSIVNNSYKVLILHHIDQLDMFTQHALRRILEIYINNCRFILMTDKLCKITKPLQSRCLLVRIPEFSTDKIFNILNLIYKAEIIENPLYNNISDVSLRQIAIKSNNNVKHAIFNLESYMKRIEIVYDYEETLKQCIYDIMCYKYPKNNIQQIQQIQNNPNEMKICETNIMTKKMLTKIDDILYVYLSKNKSMQTLLFTIFTEVCKYEPYKTNFVQRTKLLHKATQYDENLINGTRDLMHLQAFIYYIFADNGSTV